MECLFILSTLPSHTTNYHSIISVEWEHEKLRKWNGSRYRGCDNETQTAFLVSAQWPIPAQNAFKESFANLHRLQRGSRQAAASIKNYKHKPSVEASEADNRLIHLALCALADFELDNLFLLPFIREIASVYLNYDEIMVRKQASLTCSKLWSRLLLLSVQKHDKIGSDIKQSIPTIHIG